jgi:ionotropic glutamate receptor NMDA 2B
LFLVKHEFSFGNSLWLAWVLLFRAAAVVVQPRGFTSKFMSNIWALFSMAFMASYTANLAAFMVTKEEFHNIKGLEDERVRIFLKKKVKIIFFFVLKKSL